MLSSPHFYGQLGGEHTALNNKPYSLKCKGASKEFFSSSKIGFFGWWTAKKKELMGCVHELQLLPFKIRTQENISNLMYKRLMTNSNVTGLRIIYFQTIIIYINRIIHLRNPLHK